MTINIEELQKARQIISQMKKDIVLCDEVLDSHLKQIKTKTTKAEKYDLVTEYIKINPGCSKSDLNFNLKLVGKNAFRKFLDDYVLNCEINGVVLHITTDKVKQYFIK